MPVLIVGDAHVQFHAGQFNGEPRWCILLLFSGEIRGSSSRARYSDMFPYRVRASDKIQYFPSVSTAYRTCVIGCASPTKEFKCHVINEEVIVVCLTATAAAVSLIRLVEEKNTEDDDDDDEENKKQRKRKSK